MATKRDRQSDDGIRLMQRMASGSGNRQANEGDMRTFLDAMYACVMQGRRGDPAIIGRHSEYQEEKLVTPDRIRRQGCVCVCGPRVTERSTSAGKRGSKRKEGLNSGSFESTSLTHYYRASGLG
jgi:hypothetical protein